MLNRRHLRIKVLQILYAFYQTENAEIYHSEKELMKSINKMYDLYLYFLLLFEEIYIIAERKVEDKKSKGKSDDVNTKIIENEILKRIIINQNIHSKSQENKVSWGSDEKKDMIKKLYLALSESEIFQDYVESDERNFEKDKEFIIELFKTEMINFSLLFEFLENDNIYWQDDIDLVCSMIIKTIKSISEENNEYSEILPLFKDESEELDFCKNLIRSVVKNDAYNNKFIDELTKNWDIERIAKMDVILLKMAITELMEFSSIPKKVTLNEYIEIAKFYSTPQSKVFINGVLDKAVVILEKEGKITKTGRGLMN